MPFTKQQLQKFAHLIRIGVSGEQLEKMQIGGIINWIDKLQKIDTAGIEPMLTPIEKSAPLRDDVVADGGNRDAILSNAPDKDGISRGYFSVPKMMD